MRLVEVKLKPWGTGHRYVAIVEDSQGKQHTQYLQRVTSILGTLNKEALIPWAVGQTLDACKEKIVPGKVYQDWELVDIWEWAKDAQFRTKEQAAQYGTRAHQIIEKFLHTAGEWPDVSEEPMPVQNSVALFREWWEQQQFQVTDLEAYVAHTDLGYGGTIDCLARNPAGDLVLLDWKTSKSVYNEMHLQCIAYGGALAKMGLGMPTRADIIRIGKEDGEFEVVTVWHTLRCATCSEPGRGPSSDCLPGCAARLWQTWQNLVLVAQGVGDLERRRQAEWRKKKKQQNQQVAS
jgi:hypothetical protein